MKSLIPSVALIVIYLTVAHVVYDKLDWCHLVLLCAALAARIVEKYLGSKETKPVEALQQALEELRQQIEQGPDLSILPELKKEVDILKSQLAFKLAYKPKI